MSLTLRTANMTKPTQQSVNLIHFRRFALVSVTTSVSSVADLELLVKTPWLFAL